MKKTITFIFVIIFVFVLGYIACWLKPKLEYKKRGHPFTVTSEDQKKKYQSVNGTLLHNRLIAMKKSVPFSGPTHGPGIVTGVEESLFTISWGTLDESNKIAKSAERKISFNSIICIDRPFFGEKYESVVYYKGPFGYTEYAFLSIDDKEFTKLFFDKWLFS